jgi:hypothetical protein
MISRLIRRCPERIDLQDQGSGWRASAPGRSELILALPESAYVDVEIALSMLHAAESAVAVGDWRRAWLGRTRC